MKLAKISVTFSRDRPYSLELKSGHWTYATPQSHILAAMAYASPRATETEIQEECSSDAWLLKRNNIHQPVDNVCELYDFINPTDAPLVPERRFS